MGARVKTTRPQRELEFLMLAHPNPNKPKERFDGEKLVEVRETDLLMESKKNKAQARQEQMGESNGAKKSIYAIHKQVQYEIDNNIIRP